MATYRSWKIDEYKTCASAAMATAIDLVLDLMGKTKGVTVPWGHPKHLQKLRDHVMVILCNLVYVPDGYWVAVKLGNGAYQLDRSRQGFQLTSANVIKVARFLRKEGYIEKIPGFSYPGEPGRVSLIRRTDKLGEILEVDRPAIVRDTTYEPLVVMKGKKKWPPKKEWKDGKRPEHYRDIKTPAGPVVRQMQQELTDLNRLIQNARIELDTSTDHKVDLTRTHIRRSFIDDNLKLGGRFYGGFWESVNKKIRKKILIDGMQTWECDFSELHPSMLYCMVGVTIPPEGIYRLPNYLTDKPGRKLIKSFMMDMINNDKKVSAIKAMLTEHWKKVRKAKKEGKPEPQPPIEMTYVNLEQLADRILEHHRPIASYLDGDGDLAGQGGVGNKLMYEDSEIINRVMLHFEAQDIVTLPVHDSLIVPLKYVPECRKAMNVAFKERFGQDIPITGWLLEGLLDALDRPAAEKRDPEFLALCHQMAYDLADTGEYLFLDNREIYQAVKQLLVDFPPGSDGPDGTYVIKADDDFVG